MSLSYVISFYLLCICDCCIFIVFWYFFFFKQKTAYEMRISDWSSDVCSSDLPQQSWNLELEATRNLGAWGTATARLYGSRITDIVDIVPIGEAGQAPGNLDSATLYGVHWTSTFNFDPIGWKGAKIDLDLQFEKTRLKDPLTGLFREINENAFRQVAINFRHDVPQTDWAYGWGIDHFAQTPGFRLDQKFQFFNTPGEVEVFVEHKNVMGLTVRGSVDNILDR